MSVPSLHAHALTFRWPDGTVLWEGLDFTIGPGLSLVRGGDGRGKTTLLKVLAGVQAPGAGTVTGRPPSRWWAPVAEADHDAIVARAWLAQRRGEHAGWNTAVESALAEAFALGEHLDKPLYMLSAGSRRKVGLVGAAASGAALTLLDTPFAALDGRSRQVLGELLAEAAGGRERAWVIADHDVPAALAGVAWAAVVELGD